MEYSKPYLSFEQQADQLTARGLGGCRTTLLDSLSTIGYYRLSGYWYIFHDNDVFHSDATIEKVMRIYDFDRQFRLVILNALEHIEIYFRTQLAHCLAEKYGPFGYLKNDGLPRLKQNTFNHFIQRCHDSFERSREPFVLHFQNKYSNGDKKQLPPVWMMVNVMDFGQVVTLYKGAPVEVRQFLAAQFGITARVLESWLLSLNTVRNICAHHGRLWNRTIGTKPSIPNQNVWHIPYDVKPDKMFAILIILQYLLNVISHTSEWRKRLDALMDKYPDIERKSMGFTEGWEQCALWDK